jgi:hypothetical protein
MLDLDPDEGGGACLELKVDSVEPVVARQHLALDLPLTAPSVDAPMASEGLRQSIDGI